MAITDNPDHYYTYDGRLASFQIAQPLSGRRMSNVSSKTPKSIKWPHSFLPPDQMAKAGFFHYPTQENPDNTVCFLCRKSMDGWEEDDDPLMEHLKHSPNCGWAIVTSIENRDSDLSQEYPLSTKMIEARKSTFGERWPHENKKGWKCKVKQLVDAGWKYTPTPEYDDMATCAYCELALDGWEPSDKPMDEHHKRSPDCTFFILITEHQESANTPKKPVKGRKPRASKTSRLSIQSTYTVASEAPSVADLAAEEDDSVLTTATIATATSKSGRKMAKVKKAGNGRKTKAKKDEAVEISIDMEPEDADFEVKVEQPKGTRGKKRSSEEMSDVSTVIEVQPPPAKRRGTRNTRASVAAADQSFATSYVEKDTDVEMAQADDTVHEKKGPIPKKGRPSNTKSQRNFSTASAASKASLRMTMPDEDEIDRALEADLERPLTDEEFEKIPIKAPKSRRESRLKKSAVEASVAPVRKITARGSKIHKDYDMFATDDVSIDDSAIDAELKAIELEEAKPLPKAKGAKGKQSRKPSAKQQAATKQAAEAAEAVESGMNMVGEKTSSMSQGDNADPLPSAKPRKGRKITSSTASRKIFDRTTQATSASMNEASTSDLLDSLDGHDSGNDSDASMASQSTVIRGGAKRRGSNMKKTKAGNKGTSKNIEEIIHRSEDMILSQQEVKEAPQKKRAGRPKKADGVEESVGMETVQPEAVSMELGLEPHPATKVSKAKAAKPKGKGKALHDPPTELESSEQVHQPMPESPKPAPKEITPPVSPQSSDAENQPPSSKPSTIKQVNTKPQGSRIPLSASTPTMSPSKRNIIAGLRTSHPWTAVDLDEILLQSPSAARAEKENAMSGLLAEAVGKIKKGELTSPEKKMTVEEWIMYNASLAEEKLKGDCERMVGVFEREGGRAMRVLEGVVCAE